MWQAYLPAEPSWLPSFSLFLSSAKTAGRRFLSILQSQKEIRASWQSIPRPESAGPVWWLIPSFSPASQLMLPSSRDWKALRRMKQSLMVLGSHWVMITSTHTFTPMVTQLCLSTLPKLQLAHQSRATKCGLLEQAPHQCEPKPTNTSLQIEAHRHIKWGNAIPQDKASCMYICTVAHCCLGPMKNSLL